jgi:hypothetical protein
MPPKLKAAATATSAVPPPRPSVNPAPQQQQQQQSPATLIKHHQTSNNNNKTTPTPATTATNPSATHHFHPHQNQQTSNSNSSSTHHLPQQQHSKLFSSNKHHNQPPAGPAYDIYNFSNINDYDPTVFTNLLGHPHHQNQQQQQQMHHHQQNQHQQLGGGGGHSNSFQKTSNKHVSLVKTADDLIKRKRTAFRSAKNTSNVFYDPEHDVVDLSNNNYNNDVNFIHRYKTNNSMWEPDDGQPVWTYRSPATATATAAPTFNDDYNGILVNNMSTASTSNIGGGSYERSRSGPTTPVAHKNTLMSGGFQTKQLHSQQQSSQQQSSPGLFACGLFSGSKMSSKQQQQQQAAAATAALLDKPSPIKDFSVSHATSSHGIMQQQPPTPSDFYVQNFSSPQGSSQLKSSIAGGNAPVSSKNFNQMSPVLNLSYSMISNYFKSTFTLIC